MTFRRLIAADTTVSLFLHGLKIAVALFVNWIVLNLFAVDDFVTWSVTSSILIVATASDLGIGQYTVTRLIHTPEGAWAEVLSEALGAIIPMALAASVFVVLALDGPSMAYKATMAALLAGRVVTIPFAAALNAANRFRVRKAIELVAYVIAAIGVGTVAAMGSDVLWALLWLNLTFLLGAGLTVAAASRHLALRRAVRLPPIGKAAAVFRAAVPFMANNLTGLLTYGGFIWLSSLVLNSSDVAKLAVLHGFVLVNLYQLYDVFLKARQADLVKPEWVRRTLWINWLVMAALPPAFVLTGRQALDIIGNPLPISSAEAALFGVFMACELGNLYAQSVVQVNAALVERLKIYAFLRLLILVAFVVTGLVPAKQGALLALLVMLVVSSIATFAYLIRGTVSLIERNSGAPAGETYKP